MRISYGPVGCGRSHIRFASICAPDAGEPVLHALQRRVAAADQPGRGVQAVAQRPAVVPPRVGAHPLQGLGRGLQAVMPGILHQRRGTEPGDAVAGLPVGRVARGRPDPVELATPGRDVTLRAGSSRHVRPGQRRLELGCPRPRCGIALQLREARQRAASSRSARSRRPGIPRGSRVTDTPVPRNSDSRDSIVALQGRGNPAYRRAMTAGS